MACFLVPAAEAVVTTIVSKSLKVREEKTIALKSSSENPSSKPEAKISLSRKLKWLNSMLWGGSILLAFEHLWHGEIVPWFPFLTAVGDPGQTKEMLLEMATVGTSMAILITAVWGLMVIVAGSFEKRNIAVRPQVEKGEEG